MSVIAEQATTLGEGAILSVRRVMTGRTATSHLELVAMKGRNSVRMSLRENAGNASLPLLLKLIQREIERRRGMLTSKPPQLYRTPRTMADFVLAMAFNDMFVFLNDFKLPAQDVQGSDEVPREAPRRRRKRSSK